MLSGTPAPGTAGTYPISVTASNGFSQPPAQNLVLTVDGPPSITSAAASAFREGTADSFTVTASGLPAPALSETGALPSGVTFTDNGNGTAALAGTPAAGTDGTYPFTITAGNGVGVDAAQSFVLTVGQAPAFTNATSATFTEGSLGSFAFAASGSPPPTFSESGSLPAGVGLGGDGTLAGVADPGTSGTYPFTVLASNGIVPDATEHFVLFINGPPAITSNGQTVFTPLALGTYNIESRGYPAPTYTETGALPSGLTLTTHGVLFGTPAAGSQGVYVITMTASNGYAPDATQVLTIFNGFVVFTTSLPAGTRRHRYAAALATLGGTGPLAWSVAGGTLPPGLRIKRTGAIVGTPTTPGTYTFTVQVTGTTAATPPTRQAATAVLAITVAAAAKAAPVGPGRSDRDRASP